MTVVIQSDSNEVIGIAPFYRTYTTKLGKCIRLLGSDHVCSDYLRILADPQNIEQVVSGIASLVRENSTSDSKLCWDAIELTGVKTDEPSINLLCQKMSNFGHPVHCEQLESSWKVELPDTCDAYRQRLGKSFRRAVKKLQNELVETGRARLFQATDVAGFNIAWDSLVRLHQKRRDSLGDSGCFFDRRFTAFLKQTALKALAQDRLFLHWTELDGAPISASIGMRINDEVSMYQTGLDSDFISYRPGHLHNLLVIQDAIRTGVKSYDFLRGNEVYKKLWRAEPVQLTSIQILSNRLVSQLRHRAWLTGRVVKDWIKSVKTTPAG